MIMNTTSRDVSQQKLDSGQLSVFFGTDKWDRRFQDEDFNQQKQSSCHHKSHLV